MEKSVTIEVKMVNTLNFLTIQKIEFYFSGLIISKLRNSLIKIYFLG